MVRTVESVDLLYINGVTRVPYTYVCVFLTLMV